MCHNLTFAHHEDILGCLIFWLLWIKMLYTSLDKFLVNLYFQVQAHTVLLQPANTLRDEVLGQGMATLFKKPDGGEDDRLSVWKNYLTRVRIQASFKLKGRRVKLVANFLIPVRAWRGCDNPLFLQLST